MHVWVVTDMDWISPLGVRETPDHVVLAVLALARKRLETDTEARGTDMAGVTARAEFDRDGDLTVSIFLAYRPNHPYMIRTARLFDSVSTLEG